MRCGRQRFPRRPAGARRATASDPRWASAAAGVVLEQLQANAAEALASFQALVATGGVELLSETYCHSLASLAEAREFADQVQRHDILVQLIFGRRPRVFRNTELIYGDALAPLIAGLGFRGVLVEGTAGGWG